MIQIPFSKWTLKFSSQESSQQYEELMNQERVKYLRILGPLLAINTIGELIIDTTGGDLDLHVWLQGVFILGCIVIILLCNRFIQHTNMMYFSLIVFFMIMRETMATDHEMSYYLFGLTSGILGIILIQFCNLKTKILLLLLLNIHYYDSMNITNYVNDFTFFSFAVVFTYKYEHDSRMSYSNDLFQKKQKGIINHFMSSSLVIMSLNDRTNQFELEFHNQAAQRQYGIIDSDTMKDVLRKTVIQPKNDISINDMSQNLIYKSCDNNSHRITNRKQTLEEFAFHTITSSLFKSNLQPSDGLPSVHQGLMKQESLQTFQQVQITLKQCFLGKNTLIIVIDEDSDGKNIEKYLHQINYLNKVIRQFVENVTAYQVRIFKSISQINNKTSSKMSSLKCLNLLALNNYYNYLSFFNQGKFDLARSKQIFIYHYIQDLIVYFTQIASRSNIHFKLQLLLPETCTIRNSGKHLTQVLLNLIEMALEQATPDSLLTLVVEVEKEINPLRKATNDILLTNSPYYKNPYNATKELNVDALQSIKRVDSEHAQHPNQQLIKFSLIYYTSRQFEQLDEDAIILNPQSSEDYMHNNIKDFRIVKPITKMLISQIGPYNDIIIQSKELQIQNQRNPDNLDFPSMKDIQRKHSYSIQQLFIKQERFYIYSDLSQLSVSYVQSIQPKCFIQL